MFFSTWREEGGGTWSIVASARAHIPGGLGTPVGGRKKSGNGQEGGKNGIADFPETKAIIGAPEQVRDCDGMSLRTVDERSVCMKIIVTGAAGALGRAVAARAVELGHAVVGIDRVEDPAGANSGNWIICPNLAEPGACDRAIEQAVEQLGDIDAVAHCVGAFAFATLDDASPEQWSEMLTINLMSAVVTIRSCLPRLKNGATIVAVGALAAQYAGKGMSAYAASKSALAKLIEATCAENRTRGIRANLVLPAIIDTPQNRLDMPDTDPANWTSPGAIANVVCFLLDPLSSAINGASIPVSNPAR
ncbi:SDR family NAD(P)-dependent oxidoreductase [Novosphingobium sp. FSW06-99]|uniref:SDR family NAD(P)-dependent oxidoreductase n=1 Tax=Novosphingobium sp. FSW06-99 TaxID=1739113 RepID=UPI0009EAF1C4|nr:SDR family NAD(P)-dependent oxidoreductase [Novosphingobium sp. FSW06-99]